MSEPRIDRLSTPPGSIVRVRVDPDQGEETFALAEELHRQTGLPVVVVTTGAELSVTTPEEAADALGQAQEAAAVDGALDYAGASAERILDHLRAEGWELIRLRQP